MRVATYYATQFLPAGAPRVRNLLAERLSGDLSQGFHGAERNSGRATFISLHDPRHHLADLDAIFFNQGVSFSFPNFLNDRIIMFEHNAFNPWTIRIDRLRKILSGTNLGPGTPVIHFEQWEKDEIEVKLLLKGGGCENCNAQYAVPVELAHLGRADRNLEGVRKCILHAVWQAQGQGCAPGAIGVWSASVVTVMSAVTHSASLRSTLRARALSSSSLAGRSSGSRRAGRAWWERSRFRR